MDTERLAELAQMVIEQIIRHHRSIKESTRNEGNQNREKRHTDGPLI